MNERVKKLWLEALRSGKYEQAVGRLRIDDRFCCLGVLCDLHAKETGGMWLPDPAGVEDTHMVYAGADCVLPGRVREWAGLDSQSPQIEGSSSLAYYNDMGEGFHFIADRIEKYL